MKNVILILIFGISYLSGYSQETETFKDSRDGKVYKTVKIGTQTWMVENMAFKSDNGCWAYGDDQSNISTFGYLYTFETAQNTCPSGWHLPSDSEWTILENSLGGDKIAGGKLKDKGTIRWQSPNTGASNESGFTAIPVGFRYTNGSYLGATQYGYWWCSTMCGKNSAWTRRLYFDKSEVLRYKAKNDIGLSVRCVKDN